MHAPPPYQITLRRFGAWRIGCGALVASSLAAVMAWAPAAASAHTGWFALSAVLWAVMSSGLCFHAARLAPISLRWDGQCWHLGAVAAVDEPEVGRLSVSLDLGGWMLLRFAAQDARRRVWLPAQRRGHEAAWHGLRATVYCARPVSLPTAAPF